jgi:sec-independent protein translocase protein TatC
MDYRVVGYGLLQDLKKKLMYLIVAVVAGLMIGWYVAYLIIVNLKSKMLPEGVELIALTPLEFVIVQLKLSVVLVILAILPYIAYLLLKRFNIKKSKPTLLFWAAAFVTSFVTGVLFGYHLLLPRFIKFLTGNIQGAGMEPLYSVNDFVFFSMSMMLIFGLVFEFPVVTVLLTRAGVISPKTLSEKRRYSYVGFFVVAAVLTPDPMLFNQTIIAVMFIFFYELSIIVSKIVGVK